MKKVISLLLFLLITSATAFAQGEQQYYIYGIVNFEKNFDQKDLSVKFDDGKSVKKLKNAKGKDIKFRTPAAAIMYFNSKGWELYKTGITLYDGMYNYLILRKPCSKDEQDKAIELGIKK